MIAVPPAARLGIILSSGNWTLETYFRAYAPQDLGIHVTRMRMGSGGGRTPQDMETDIRNAARLLADVKIDLIDLQGTGIMMERGPGGEADIVSAIEDATGIPAYTATGAAVEAMRAVGMSRLVQISPYGEDARARESAYLQEAGFTIVDSIGLNDGRHSNDIAPAEWIAAATSQDWPTADGIFFSGSNTRMVEAIAPTEAALGRPVVTSVQAALWAGIKRLAPRLGPPTAQPALGKLFATL